MAVPGWYLAVRTAVLAGVLAFLLAHGERLPLESSRSPEPVPTVTASTHP